VHVHCSSVHTNDSSTTTGAQTAQTSILMQCEWLCGITTILDIICQT